MIARLSTPLRADVSSVLLEWWQLGCHKGADVRHTQSIMGSDHDGCCQQHLCQHCVHFNCSTAATFNPPNLEKNLGQVIRYFLPHRKWQASQLAVKHMKQIPSMSSYAYPQPRPRADGCRHLMLGWIFGRNVAGPLSHYRRPCPRLRLEIKMSWPVEVTCNYVIKNNTTIFCCHFLRLVKNAYETYKADVGSSDIQFNGSVMAEALPLQIAELFATPQP